MKLNFKTKSIIYNWIISYTMIILILVVASGIIYFINKRVIEEEIITSNRLLLDKIRDNTDNIFSDARRLSLEVMTSQYIQNILTIDDTNDSSEYFSIYKAANDLSNYKVYNSAIKRFYIYLNKLKVVLTQGVLYQQNSFYENYLSNRRYDIKQWLDTMHKSYRGEYRIMPFHEDGTGEIDTISYISSLPIPQSGNVSANLVILLDPDKIVSNNTNDRNLLIMDDIGNIITGNNLKHNEVDLSYQELEGEHGNIVKYMEGKKVICSYATSRTSAWKYITIIPESVFWEKAQRIRNIMLAGIAVYIFLGGLITFIFLKKNYNPLKEVVTYFQDKLKIGTGRDGNEYTFIRQAFNQTFEQKERIQIKLEQQSKALKSSFMADLLKGRETSIPVHEILTSYNIAFKYSHFTIITIFVESMDKDFWVNDEKWEIDKYDMSGFIITNVLEELINHNYCGYVNHVDDMLTCLVNTDLNVEIFRKGMSKIIIEAKQFIEENFKIHLSFAMGGIHEGIKGIPEAYNEAVKAMEYCRVMGVDNMVIYDEIVWDHDNYYYYPVDREYQLINCIKAGDFKAASIILDEIFKKNFDDNSPTLEIIHCLMFDLTSTVLKTANEIDKGAYKNFFDRLKPTEELLKCKTFLEMKNKILQIIEEACNLFVVDIEHVDYRLRDTVREIIDNNFSDPNLGIASIADLVGKHPYYVSRMFKEQTGEGILEYINSVRINKAKELIKENTWNQEEIAEKVGYTNIRTFHRAFKKLEGTSPGKMSKI